MQRSHFSIRPVQSLDELKSVWAFVQAGFELDEGHARGFPFYAQMFLSHPGLLLVAVDDTQLCGALLASIEGDHVLIGEVYVAPGYRGQGLGSQLLVTLEQQAHRIGQRRLLLGAAEGAEQFYLRNGYVPLLFITVDDQHAAALDHLLETDLASYPVRWRDTSSGASKAIVQTNVVDKLLQQRVEQSLPNAATQYLFTKEL